MSPQTQHPLFDPITPDNAVLLLVDQQEGLFSRILEPEQTRNNLFSLARGTKVLGVPTVMTTNPVAGPQLDALTKLYAAEPVIERTIINAWQDQRVHEAITATRRKKLLIAGTGFDICAALPALASVAEGYDTYVVYDACGRFEPLPVAAITRLAQAGVVLVNARTIVLEMMADNAHPSANQIFAALSSA